MAVVEFSVRIPIDAAEAHPIIVSPGELPTTQSRNIRITSSPEEPVAHALRITILGEEPAARPLIEVICIPLSVIRAGEEYLRKID